ncbi:hypothetical protein [Microcoleus sp.]|uniref:hypothetical protein n=1 Tax=Microcoleus sp. TaxID=44472 RepID=UPI0035933492
MFCKKHFFIERAIAPARVLYNSRALELYKFKTEIARITLPTDKKMGLAECLRVRSSYSLAPKQ